MKRRLQELAGISTNEAISSDVSDELYQLNLKITDYYRQLENVSWAMSRAGYDDKQIDDMYKSFEKIRDLHNKTMKVFSRKLK